MNLKDEIILTKESKNFKIIFLNRLDTTNEKLSIITKIIELKDYKDMSKECKKQRQKYILKTLATYLPVPIIVNEFVAKKILKELEKTTRNIYFA